MYEYSTHDMIEGTGTLCIGGTSIVGSGSVSGTWPLFSVPHVPWRGSNIAILGSASSVVGCGTLIATSGTITGSATIIGCKCRRWTISPFSNDHLLPVILSLMLTGIYQVVVALGREPSLDLEPSGLPRVLA